VTDELRRHTARALDAHEAWCRLNGVALPRGWRAWRASLLGGTVGFGRDGGRELVDYDAALHGGPVTVTYAEAARALGVSTRTLRRWRASGRISGLGRRLMADDVARIA
jgi:hypothetical protein